MKRAAPWALVAAAGLLVAGGMAALRWGQSRWAADTVRLRSALEHGATAGAPTVAGAHALEGLPAPVQRFFRAVLADGQPLVAAMTVSHRGMLNLSDTGARWKPFTSTQRVRVHRPGFVWDGRVRMLPGLPIYVHDAYVAGEGRLQVSAMGLHPMADLRGTPGLARAELMRWLAEAVWYPTALLPGQGVQWDAVDDRSAYATVTDGDTRVRLLFRFEDDGTIGSVRAEARERVVDDTVTTAPWEGRFWNYALRDGMRVPLDAEVAWILAGGPHGYFRATITALAYEFVH